MSAAIFGHDIRATHRRGRKLRPALIVSNERSPAKARAELRRLAAELPELRLVLVERDVAGGERILDA